ncbi:HNH endonuclease [Candidatus Poriferisodalis sp.]|uniref:HNH endonuclease signature motif containing protein n=1 Tax=Candidatus Poriferisodalis sp. TaxID=3101277 RepID=UPI003B5226AC
MFSHVEQALGHLTSALDAVDAASSDQLRRTLALSKQLRSRVELLETKAAALVARREDHGDGGAGLLSEHSGLSRSDAARNVRTGAELASIPDADEGVAAGQISLANAARLARAARKTSPGAVQHDPGLIGLAKTLPADEFAHAARRWEAQHQDAADLAAQHRRNRRNRHVRFWNGEDGSVQMRGSFDSETGARIQQRLRRQAEQHRQADRRRAQHPNRAAGGDNHNNDNDNDNGNGNDSNGSGGGGATGPATEQRTTDQRMADALDTLLAAGTAAQSTGTTAQSTGTTAQSAGTTAQQGVRTPPAQTARLAAGQAPPPGTPQGVRTPPAQTGPADQRPDTNLPPQPDLLRPPDTDSPRPGRHGHAEGTDQSEPTLLAVPAPTVGRKAAAEIIVRADLAALADQPGGFAEICGVGPIPPGALARLACNSDVWVEIFGDTLTPLYETVARRAPTAAQRRALIARDGACIGCGALPLECEAHHVIPWKSGGKTHVDNLVLVCWSCHDRIHDHNWHVVLRDGRYRLMPPDPAQPPNLARSRKPKHRTPHQPAPADTSQLLPLSPAAPPAVTTATPHRPPVPTAATPHRPPVPTAATPHRPPVPTAATPHKSRTATTPHETQPAA